MISVLCLIVSVYLYLFLALYTLREFFSWGSSGTFNGLDGLNLDYFPIILTLYSVLT